MKTQGRRALIESLEGRQLLAGVTTSLTLYDMSGTTGVPIAPSSPGVYNIQQGTTFRVVISATVASPNFTSSSRADSALRHQPLGIENLTTDVLSSGKGIVNPVQTPTATVPRWTGYRDLTPDHFGFPFTNIVDVDGDADPDVDGAGIASFSFTLDSSAVLPSFQYGAGTGATAGPMKLIQGEYVATAVGNTKLTTKVTSANVYADLNSDDSVTAEAVAANSVNGSITINVIKSSVPGGISGEVYQDKNANGAIDSGESGIANALVFIDANKNGALDSGELQTTADSGGKYSFAGLGAGSYRVHVVAPFGFHATAPAGGFSDITVGTSVVTGKNFGMQQNPVSGTGSISGTVFNDANKNGKLDTGDSRLSARKMYIDANKNGKLDSGEKTATSNASGVYTFSGLSAGTYEIRRADTPAGYSFTEPASGFYDVTLTAGQVVTGKDFGAILGKVSGGNTASISGTVFNDGNDNGKRDAGESLLAARKIYIDANKNGKLDSGEISVLTNASGVYTFSGLAAGTYEIRRADTPAGYKITDPASGFYDITVVAGQVVTGKDIGAFA